MALTVCIVGITYLLLSLPVYARPVDLQGVFGADTTMLKNYKHVAKTYSGPANNGGQQIGPGPGDHKDLAFQSYLLKLNPSVIINDGASFFAEISNGYNRGGIFGDSLTQKKSANDANNNFGDALYLQNTANGRANMLLSQFYLKLYADTATYVIGRHTFHWGLGAVFNEGNDVWDRFSTIQDGITVKIKVGNFHFSPFWAKINSLNDLTAAGNTKTYGVTLLYDSVERDIAFGLVYGKRSTGAYNTVLTTNNRAADGRLGRTEIKVVDIFLKKALGDFSFALEAPIIKGKMGNVYSSTDNTTYNALAVITESTYKFNDNWTAGAMIGHVSGADGSPQTFGAMYLNPNYKIANILFRYNWNAVTDFTQSIYDSYITNTKYIRVHGAYNTGLWTLTGGIVAAKANEIARGNGTTAYNHTSNRLYTSQYAQDRYLGTELDFGVNYQWNSNVSINADLGYLFVGDYYRFTNTTTPVDIKNIYAGTVGVAATF